MTSKHKIARSTPISKKCDSEPNPKRIKTGQTLISSYRERKTQQRMYAELAAVDRLSFHQIATSHFIHDAMQSKMLSAHTSPNTIRSKVKEFYEYAKEDVKKRLQSMRDQGTRFTLTFDEWSGLNMRRYLTINIHAEQPVWFNLGMVRVWGSQTAATLLKLVETRLSEYGLCVEDDIVAMVTDGASIMKKLGRLASCEHVICLAHTIHLVVGDVLYKKKKKKAGPADEEASDTEAEDDAGQNGDSAESGEEPDVDEGDDHARLPDSLTDIETSNPPELSDTIDPVVQKVRTIVKKFRKSPVKNDILQKVIAKKHDKELKLIKDCKTRWSSLCAMLERFVRVFPEVDQVLNDLELYSLRLSDHDLDLVKEIISALAPFKVLIFTF